MEKTTNNAKGVLILSIAGILSKVISVVYTPVLNAILGSEGYGIYVQVMDVFLFIYAITSVGVQPAVAKVVSELSAIGNEDAARNALNISRVFYLLVGALASTLMIVFSDSIANKMGSSQISAGIATLAPCIMITTVLSAYRGFMQGKGNMKAIAVSQVLEQLLNVAISLVFAYIFIKTSLPLGVAGAQIGTSVGALFACAYLIFAYQRKKYDEIESTDKTKVNFQLILQRILIYSIPIILSSGLQNLGGLIDSSNVTTILQSTGYSEAEAHTLYGYYGYYRTLIGVPMVVITAIATATLPSISKLRVLKQGREIRKKTKDALRICLAVSLPSAVGFMMIAKPLYKIFFNNNEWEAISLMAFGAFILVFMAVSQVQSSILQGLNGFYYVLMTFSIGILSKIILNYFCVRINAFNINGVLIGNFFWYLIPTILNHRKICKREKIKMSFIKLLKKPLIASLVMAAALWVLSWPFDFLYRLVGETRLTCIPELVILIGVGGFIYLYIMIMIGGIKKSDFDSISPKLLKFMPKFLRKNLK